MNYILDDNREIQTLMNQNISVILHKYGTTNTIQNFKGRTPYVEKKDDSDQNSN